MKKIAFIAALVPALALAACNSQGPETETEAGFVHGLLGLPSTKRLSIVNATEPYS